ncbi:hypothetical protein GCM10010512_24820 [Streptomyces thermoviolaceus subsp. thermoviolaceus]|nr:hypothetical protein GCM10010512_24820 [Streptomyces thermoviolaceus subsp. thermoviolaceus]
MRRVLGPRLRPCVRLRLRLRGVRPGGRCGLRVPRVVRLRRGLCGARWLGERLRPRRLGDRLRARRWGGRAGRRRLGYLVAEEGAARGDGPWFLLVTAVSRPLGHDGQGAGLLGALRTVLGACRDGSRNRSTTG